MPARPVGQSSSSTRRAGYDRFIAAQHIVGWVTLVVLVASLHSGIGTKAFDIDIDIGITAYTPGMRHAFDAQ